MTKTELNEKLSVLNSNFNVALLFTGSLEKEVSKNATIKVLTTYADKINELGESLIVNCECKKD